MDRQKIFDWVTKVFLFLSPIFLFKDYRPSLSRGLFFVIGTFALFAISLGVEPKRKFSNIWASVFLLLALVRVFFDNSMGNPQAEWFNFWMSCSGFIYVFCGMLLFYIIYTYTENAQQYFIPIVWVAILNFILAIAQYSRHDFFWTHASTINGFMEISSQLGQYSALATPILFFINPLLVIFPIVTVIISKSISSILAMTIGIGLFCVLKGIRGKIIAGIGIIALLTGLFNFAYIKAKFECRPVMWQKTVKLALDKPFLGWGYGSFKEKVTEIKAKSSLGGPEYARAHNDYLHTAQELGFPIVIVLGLFLTGIFKKFLMIKKKSKLLICLATSVVIVLINMSGQTEIRYASIAGTFIFLLALFCAEVNDASRI